MTNLTYGQKEIRKLEKKARLKERRYNESGDEKFLHQRDVFADKATQLKMNMETDRLTQKKKMNITKKTDDQLLNEAMKQNRRERNQAEKAKKLQDEKEYQINQKRITSRMNSKKKKEQQKEENKREQEEKEKYLEEIKTMKEEFQKKYLEEKPDTSPSELQKESVRHQNEQIKFHKWKVSMIHFFKSIGMNQTQAEEELTKMIENHKKNEDNDSDDDSDDPIPEEINENPRL
jgi:hypothetical protein